MLSDFSCKRKIKKVNFLRGKKKKQQTEKILQTDYISTHAFLWGAGETKGECLHGCKLFPSGIAHGPCDGKMEQIPFYALPFNIAWFVPNLNYCRSVMPWFTAIAVGMGRMHPILPSSQISP